MEVDWAGATMDIHNPVTGEVSKAYLFVAVLPCSCLTCAEACDDMKLENWIRNSFFFSLSLIGVAYQFLLTALIFVWLVEGIPARGKWRIFTEHGLPG